MKFKNFGGQGTKTKVDFNTHKTALPTDTEQTAFPSKAKMDQLHPPFASQAPSDAMAWVKNIRDQFTQNGIEPKIVINVMTSNNTFGASTAASSSGSVETGAQTVQIRLDENGCCATCHQALPQGHPAR